MKPHIRSSRSSFAFAIPDNHRHYQLWLVHDSSKRHGKSIPEFPSFMDRPRNFRIDVGRKPPRCGEPRDEILEASCIHTVLREEIGERSFDPKRSENCGCTVA